MKSLDVIDIGPLPYADAYFLQKMIVRDIRRKGVNDCVLFGEHPDIFTIGRSGSRKNILVDEEYLRQKGIEVIETDRGGDVTYHGRGQLVAYPVFDLKRHAQDVRLFLKNLERLLAAVIAEYGLTADAQNEHTGIWVGGSKVCFIGIGVSNWITYHGVSINANVDLDYFSMIRGCGIEGLRVGSLHRILGRTVGLDALKSIFLKKCCEVFGFERVRGKGEAAVVA